uniref:XK-related protein n=1 Tax=Xiphophorus couchianus TaxID=32473 RepID=A0A3B5MY88_9TELE
MESRTATRYSWIDFAFSVVGVCTFLLDWGSDLWLAKEFYCRGDLFWFGVLVGLMVLSSVVVQMFSWFWFQYDRELPGFSEQTPGAGSVFCGDRAKLFCLLHVLQLGFLCRYWSWFWFRTRLFQKYQNQKCSLLLLYSTVQAKQVTVVSVAASVASVAWMVVDYHRSLRSFLPDKAEQRWGSSIVYFLWNLLLIGPRVAALALFSSVLPGFIAFHFLLLWPTLVLWAWRQDTGFMDSAGGEWLYRATVGLIWYFSWFNVAEGRTLGRSLVYHTFVTADVAVLLTTWWSYRDPVQTVAYGAALLLALPLCYLLGLLLKTLYYCRFHPTLPPDRDPHDLPDSDVASRALPIQDGAPAAPLLNQRMACHAAHFYTDRRHAMARGLGGATCEVGGAGVSHS